MFKELFQSKKASAFLKQLRHDEIVAAIQAAEKRTSGEIRVFISRKRVEDPVTAAQEQFIRLQMDRTKEHNGVLIYVAPLARRFAVVGDSGVHTHCGDAFWRELTAEMSGHFQKSDFTQGLVHGIRKAGDLLTQHFPCHPGDKNELSDDVAHD